MDKDFEILIEEAKKILSDYASCGHVGCVLLTKSGKIYTGISVDLNCALGNCAEHAAILEMLKNNESEIDKINLDTKVMVDGEKVYKLKDLLPEMYITKNK